jgi:hypothetical protein
MALENFFHNKIESMKLEIIERNSKLRRLEAQRNDYNSRGMYVVAIHGRHPFEIDAGIYGSSTLAAMQCSGITEHPPPFPFYLHLHFLRYICKRSLLTDCYLAQYGYSARSLVCYNNPGLTSERL